MSDAQLIPRVLKVLLSPPVAKIDFWAHGMHVSAGGYVMVWFYISQGWIKLRLVRIPSQMPEGAGAKYDPTTHTLWFRRDTYGSSPDERATILHQCTHALRDVLAGPQFRREAVYSRETAV